MEDQPRILWAQVLGSQESEIASDINFFETGGDSVAAIRLVALASESGISIVAQTVFAHAVLSGLANFCSPEKPKSPRANEMALPAIAGGLLDSFLFVNNCLLQCGVDASAIQDIMPYSPSQRELMNG